VNDILLCVDGSLAGTAATRVALRLASEVGARLHALYVVEDSGLAALVDRTIDGHGADDRLAQTAESLQTRMRAMAEEAGVDIDWILDSGEPFDRIIERARMLQPRFIVMGRAGRRGPGRALVGSQVEHTLEFTEWPVIVVPATAPGR